MKQNKSQSWKVKETNTLHYSDTPEHLRLGKS